MVALGGDLALFLIGLSFASQATILPAFARYLGASHVLIGAIPAVMTLGWFLPALFTAGHTAALPQKLPFVLRYTIWERLPFVVLAITAFRLAELAPALALAVFMVMLVVITGTGGMLLPAWMDIVGRAIPMAFRGRFFAVTNVLGNAGALAGSIAITYLLAVLSPSAGYGVCFLIAAAFMGLSYIALARTREPREDVATPSMPLWAHLARVPALLRGDPNMFRFLLARALAIVGAMGSGFFTVHALQAFGAPPWEVGILTAVLRGGQILGSVAFGPLADRVGHRLVIMIGVGATVAANAVALLAPGLGTFRTVFALMGLQLAATSVSELPVLLEFAPSVADRPIYVGLGRTSQAPFAVASPLAAGLVARAVGLEPVFFAAAVFGVISMWFLASRVRDPRYERATRDTS